MLNAIIYPSVKHWLPLMLDFLEHIHYIQRSNGEQWASPRLYTIHDRWFFKAWWGCGCIWYFIIWHHMEVSNSWRYSQYRPLWFGFFITYKPCSELGDSPFEEASPIFHPFRCHETAAGALRSLQMFVPVGELPRSGSQMRVSSFDVGSSRKVYVP